MMNTDLGRSIVKPLSGKPPFGALASADPVGGAKPSKPAAIDSLFFRSEEKAACPCELDMGEGSRIQGFKLYGHR
jgi:hypothetical protein